MLLLRKSNQNISVDLSLDEFDINHFQPMYDEFSTEILKHSHILVGKSKEEQDEIRSKFKIEMIQVAGKNSLAICQGMSDEEFDRLCGTTSEQTFLKLLELNLNQTNNFNIIEYTNLLTKLQKVSGVSNDTVLEYIQNIPNCDASVTSNMRAIYPTLKTLNDLETKNKAEVVESIFFELPSGKEGIRSYIERRDRDFYYIKIDEKTGTIEEQVMDYAIFDKDSWSIISGTKSGLNIGNSKTKTIIDAQKDNLKDTRDNVPEYTDTFCITADRKHTESYITFVEDEKEISVRDSEGNIRKVAGKTIEDIKRDFAIDIVFKKINEKRKNLMYSRGTSNNLDYEQVIEDLSEARLSLSEKDFKSRAPSITRDIITEAYETESLQQYLEDVQKFERTRGTLVAEIVGYSQPIRLIEDSEERDEAITEREKTKEGNFEESSLLRNLKKIENFVFNARENENRSITDWSIKNGIPLINSAVSATKSKILYSDIVDAQYRLRREYQRENALSNDKRKEKDTNYGRGE